MDRKKIILKEILFWKENQMLPDQYCDYLLALHSQGEEISKKMPGMPKRTAGLISLLLVSLLLPISVFVIYFTELSWALQTAILTIFVVLFLTLAFYFSKKGILLPLLYVGAAILLLIFTVQLNNNIFNGNQLSLYGLIFMNCFVWWMLGKKLQLIYFTMSALVGFIVLIILFLYND